MNKIKKNECAFKYKESFEITLEPIKAHTLKVDVNNRFFALIGRHRFMVFNIEKLV